MSDFTREELVSTIECLKLYGDSFFCGLNAYETLMDKLQFMIDSHHDLNCMHQIDKVAKRCKLCKLPSSSIPCIGGWL